MAFCLRNLNYRRIIVIFFILELYYFFFKNRLTIYVDCKWEVICVDKMIPGYI